MVESSGASPTLQDQKRPLEPISQVERLHAPGDVLEQALALALKVAAEAGDLALIRELAAQLREHRERQAGNVVVLSTRKTPR